MSTIVDPSLSLICLAKTGARWYHAVHETILSQHRSDQMKVLLESSQYLYGSRAIRRYVVALGKLLPAVAPGHDFLLYYNRFRKSPYGPPPEPDAKNARLLVSRTPGRLLRLSRKLFGRPRIDPPGCDIVHFTAPMLAPTRTNKIVFTIHGLAPLVVPELIDPAYVAEQKALLQKAVDLKASFIAVSETTRREFLERFEISQDRVRAIPLGVDDSFQNGENEKKPQNRFGIDGPYVLYVGGIQKNKNIEGLLRAFAEIKQVLKDHSLVLAGELRMPSDEFELLSRRLGIEKDVKLVGHLSQNSDDLPSLYRDADVFVFPTFYEGWTSPPLEAMKCGTPVVTSNVSSLPETCGDAALYADPRDPGEIAIKAVSLVENGELRSRMIDKGLEHSAKFTWENCAKKTADFYADIS